MENEILRSIHEGSSQAEKVRNAIKSLNENELGVLKLFVESEKTNKEIADLLNMSESNTKHHFLMIFKKLGVKNRTGVAMVWRDYLALEDKKDYRKLLNDTKLVDMGSDEETQGSNFLGS